MEYLHFEPSEPISTGLTGREGRSRALSGRTVKTPDTEQNRWFSQEVQPHEPLLRAHLHSAFPSLPDVDDIVQESYFRLIQAK
jgi:hypothetical protein